METQSEIITRVKADFYNWCFGEVDRAIYGWEEGKGSLMGAFILLSCIIDYLTKFAYGPIASKNGNSGKYYKRFINEWLKIIDKRYSADDLYHNLRCGLVHHFSTIYKGKAKLLFTHNHPQAHLSDLTRSDFGENRALLDLFQFRDDIYKVSQLYFDKLEMNSNLKTNFIANYKEFGFLTAGIKMAIKPKPAN